MSLIKRLLCRRTKTLNLCGRGRATRATCGWRARSACRPRPRPPASSWRECAAATGAATWPWTTSSSRRGPVPTAASGGGLSWRAACTDQGNFPVTSAFKPETKSIIRSVGFSDPKFTLS